MNTFAGGAMEHCAIGALGIMPYISATIIIQLLTAVLPKLSKLAREEGGRIKNHPIRTLSDGIPMLGSGGILCLPMGKSR